MFVFVLVLYLIDLEGREKNKGSYRYGNRETVNEVRIHYISSRLWQVY